MSEREREKKKKGKEVRQIECSLRRMTVRGGKKEETAPTEFGSVGRQVSWLKTRTRERKLVESADTTHATHFPTTNNGKGNRLGRKRAKWSHVSERAIGTAAHTTQHWKPKRNWQIASNRIIGGGEAKFGGRMRKRGESKLIKQWAQQRRRKIELEFFV